MFKIKIYKNKIVQNVFNEDANSWEEIEINEDIGPFPRYFNDIVEINDDVTFEDIMNLMERFENDINYCFAAYTKCIPIKVYLKELRTDIKHETQIVTVEVFKYSEVLENDLSITSSMRGFMSMESAEVLGEDIDKPLRLETYNLNNLKNAKFILNENIAILNYDNLSFEFSSDILFEGFCEWTLHDLFSTVLSVITAHGTPDERGLIGQKKIFDTLNSKGDIKMWIELFEEAINEEKANKELALAEERYEEVIIINSNIANLELKIKEFKEELSKISNNEKVF
jgi:hypothetical protein